MPSPNATPTPITPPRVPLIDPRTGLIDRAWYLFFLSLNNIATGVIDDGGTGADTISLLASYDAALLSVNQELQTQPSTSAVESQVAEIQKQIEALNASPNLRPPSVADVSGLGTMAVQNADAVAITGGTINNTTIGATTPSTGVFTTLTATGTSYFGGVAGSEVVRVSSGTNTGKYTNFSSDSASNAQLVGATAGANFVLFASGTNSIKLRTNGAAGNDQMFVAHTASAVNYVQVTGGATTKAVIQSAQGSDSNISYVTQSKGTGAIDLAAGSSGVNISNGGTVTALTRTAGGSAYTSFPSVAISAPTTAGGVQATATVTRMFNSTPTIQSGGTGYTVGDVLTIVGGTPVTVAGTYTVATVSAGVITSVTNTLLQAYTALPTNPVSVTGGTGSGATLNLTYQVDPGGLTIGTAGSGYVEQPTVTFSGGGGSGAAAYATVGSGTVIRSLGSTMSFSTPNGESFRVTDQGVTSANYASARANSTGNSPFFLAQGSDTNVGLASFTKGTGSLVFGTNSGTTQVVVAHTASAVNFVQVTGAATGAGPTISVQGSNADIDFNIAPKGAGNIRFGTYTASALLPVTGYITIKDSGGTTRRLLVG